METMVIRRASFAKPLLVLLLALLCISAPAQTMARKGQMGPGASNSEPWWKHAVFYEIYPRSFQDSNGDGVGDLNGITSRLDYLQSLGIDAIWLTPIYPSPQVDFGYDVADYTAIDPQYGTMDDFDKLVAEASRRHIRVLMDLVLNHTSDKNPWFIESASSKDNPKADWYMWHDGKQNGSAMSDPPNNWQAGFGHSAWQWVPTRNQFYYHFFYPQQPDLNWRNPEVKKAMYDAVRFWLSRGVAGFRLDAIDTIFEDPSLKDEATSPGTNAYGDPNTSMALQTGQPEVHDVMRDLRNVVNSVAGQRVLIGEIYTDKIEKLVPWYGAKHDELQLPMDTELGFPPGEQEKSKLDAAAFRQHLTDAQTKLAGNQPLFVFDNHDRPRSWDRYGDGTHNADIARVIATIELESQAAAILYYGQELGMVTTTPTRKEDVKDPIGIIGWPQEKGRDGERTPMQWSPTANAGFSTAVKTWLPVPATAANKDVNADAEQADTNSLLHWYQRLIQLRRDRAALLTGTQTMIDRDAQNALVWVRTPENISILNPPVLIVCNLGAQPLNLQLKADVQKLGLHYSFTRTLLRSHPTAGPTENLTAVHVPPFGVYIGELAR